MKLAKGDLMFPHAVLFWRFDSVYFWPLSSLFEPQQKLYFLMNHYNSADLVINQDSCGWIYEGNSCQEPMQRRETRLHYRNNGQGPTTHHIGKWMEPSS